MKTKLKEKTSIQFLKQSIYQKLFLSVVLLAIATTMGMAQETNDKTLEKKIENNKHSKKRAVVTSKQSIYTPSTPKAKLSDEELKAMEIKRLAEKKSKPRDGMTEDAKAYMRSLGHPEFNDVHGPERKAAIEKWAKDNVHRMEEIKAEFQRLNKQ